MESFFVRYRNLLVLLILLLVQIIGLAMQVRRLDSGRRSLDNADSSGVRLIRLWANAAVSPVERVVENSKTGVFGFWKNYVDLRHVRQQNQDLKDTVDRLRLEQAALLEDARQGQRLQAMLGFQQKYLYQTLPAQIIGSSGSDQSRVFYVDKGKAEGLARDMAVISSDGIVGKVREVFPHTAQVLAINDQTSGAGVILETTRIRGILRGNEQGQPQIVGILADQRIKPGENVLTAGGDQIFPRGLPVGVVEKVEEDPDRDGFINIIVKPAAYLDRLDEVLIITNTEPRFSSQQQKDIATSEELKSADAAALSEQRKASAIMAERLPGLTDPNAPPKPANAPAGANGAPPAPSTTTVPKLLPPQHADRFTPGHAAQSGEQGAAAPKSPSANPAGPKPEKKEAAPGTTAAPKTAAPTSTTPQETPTVPKAKTPAKPTAEPQPAPQQPQPQRNQ
jgi:rod shape-determining protein MreC